MKIIEISGGYVLGFESRVEAQTQLDELSKPDAVKTDHDSLSENIERIVEHLKARGIDTAGPVPEAAKETPTTGGSSSTSHETIVPTEQPVAYVPIPRTAKPALSGPGEDAPVEIVEPKVEHEAVQGSGDQPPKEAA